MSANGWVKVTGLRELLAKLEPDTLYGGPLRKVLAQAAAAGEHLAEGRAPGTLSAHISSRLDAQPVPLYAVVGFLGSEPVNKGFRYARALDAAKHRQAQGQHLSRGQKAAARPKRVTKQNAPFTYASGSRKGKPTYHWLSAVAGAVKRKFGQQLKDAFAEIEANWKR